MIGSNSDFAYAQWAYDMAADSRLEEKEIEFDERCFEFDTVEFQGGVDGDHGWFEHEALGDEYGGSLWFEDKVLVDYDGIGGYLPDEIVELFERNGYDMSFGKGD